MSYWIIKEEEIDLRGLLDKQGLPGVDNDIMMCEKCFSGYFQKFFTAFKIECESILKKRDQEAEKLNRKQNETAHKLEEIKRSNFYFLGKMTKKVSGQIISKFHAFDELMCGTLIIATPPFFKMRWISHNTKFLFSTCSIQCDE